MTKALASGLLVGCLSALWTYPEAGAQVLETAADSCLQQLAQASATGGETSASARLEYLVALYSLGRVGEAMDGWSAWIREDPSVLARVDHLYWYCLALMEAERVGDAAALLEEARTAGLLDTDPSYWHGMAKELLCTAYLELGETRHATDLAQEVVRHGVVPEADILALYDLARAYELSGDGQGARQTWDLVLATADGTPEATYARQRSGATPPGQRSSPSSAMPPGETAACYCLNLGSTTMRELAQAWASRADSHQLVVSVREDSIPTGHLFTVLAGEFGTEQQALDARIRLASAGHTTVVVNQCPPPSSMTRP